MRNYVILWSLFWAGVLNTGITSGATIIAISLGNILGGNNGTCVVAVVDVILKPILKQSKSTFGNSCKYHFSGISLKIIITIWNRSDNNDDAMSGNFLVYSGWFVLVMAATNHNRTSVRNRGERPSAVWYYLLGPGQGMSYIRIMKYE